MEISRLRHIKGHGSPSSSKPYFSSNKHGRSPKSLKHSHRSEFSSKSNRRLATHELPLHLKRPFKMSMSNPSSPGRSSPKRARSDAGSEGRPAKVQKVEEEDGLNDIEDYLATSPGLVSQAEPTTNLEVLYCRRKKVAQYARIIRQKRLLCKKIKGGRSVPMMGSQRGMRNLTGDLCYRHSLFQALMHMPKTVNWLFQKHGPNDCLSDKSGACIACNLRDIAISYTTERTLTSDLEAANRSFKFNKWSPGPGSGQGDPEDQLTWMKKLLQEQLTTNDFRQFEALQSLVSDSIIECGCGHKSITENHLTSFIPLDLTPKIYSGRLTAFLERHFKDEVSGYKCSKCEDKEDKRRSHQITHLPDQLYIQLKRFNWDGRKNRDRVHFEETLTLDRFRAPTNKDDANYELASVICHRGNTMSGHYICFAKDPNGEWYEFDDSTATRVNLKNVLSPSGSFTPYLLFYQRTEKNEKNQKIEKKM